MIMILTWNSLMKKIFTYLFLAALSVAAACNKLAPVEIPMEDFSLATDMSKTVMTDLSTGAVQWTSGDDISVFSTAMSSPLNNHLTATSVSGSQARFSGQVETGTTTFVALYPYNSAATYANGVISTEIPTTQTATANSFADRSSLTFAKGTKTPGVPQVDGINFNNLCGSVFVTLPPSITFASKITVVANSGAKMAGACTIDCEKGTLTATGSSSIVLSGSFKGGNKYCFSVAPGEYKGGFTFTIQSTNGATYVRENTADITVGAGRKVTVGTLSLKMTESQITSSVSIVHDIVSNQLNGSTAKVSLNVPSDFASAVSWNVELYNSAGQLCRTYTGKGNVSAAAMTVANGWTYLPVGDYHYVVKYIVNNGTKDITTTLSSRSTLSSPAGAFSFVANLSGYTSYSTYKGTDGQSASAANANNLDGSSIYGIGASYKSGFGFDPTDSKYASLMSVKPTLDGSEVSSSTLGSQSWSSHTISAKMIFDGASGSSSTSKTVYVTGLPYNKSGEYTPKDKGAWSFDGISGWESDYFKLRSYATATFKGFYVPANINVTVAYRMEGYNSSAFNKEGTTTICKVGSTTIVNDKIAGVANTKEYKSSASATLTPSAATIWCKAACSSSSWYTSQCHFYRFGLTYR